MAERGERQGPFQSGEGSVIFRKQSPTIMIFFSNNSGRDSSRLKRKTFAE